MVNFLRRAFLNVSVASVVALLGAVPLASATGFDRGSDLGRPASERPLVWMCGFIVFCLTLAVMGPAARMIASLKATLERAETKPSPSAAIGMMACGTLCVLTSIYIAWMSSSASPLAGLKQSLKGMQDELRSANVPGISLNMNVPDVAAFQEGSTGTGSMILASLAFFVGLGLIALGVWATLPPSRQQPPIKEPIPAADAASL